MNPSPREALTACKRIVVKVGSSLIADPGGAGIDDAFLDTLVGGLAGQRIEGREVVLVSSGAVAAGCVELAFPQRPTALATIQAAAAVGQCVLMRHYRDAFHTRGLVAGQVLLTRDDLQDRRRYLHARNTLREMLRLGVVPVVNENDTVAVAELRLKLGDNDSLAVAVAQLCDADAVVILSDVPGLYDRPPHLDDATLIGHVEAWSPDLMGGVGEKSAVGSGGMGAKLDAARGAAWGAIPLVVADGRRLEVLQAIFRGEEVGTYFAPRTQRASSRCQWIAFGRPTSGRLIIDDGACRALTEGKRSLLAIGIRAVEGSFDVADTVSIETPNGEEIARGLVNMPAADVEKVKGCRGDTLADVLGYPCPETVVHRDNLVVLEARGSTDAPPCPDA